MLDSYGVVIASGVSDGVGSIKEGLKMLNYT